MTLSYTDIVITAVIIAVVLFAAHRLGQDNPVGTGKLSRRLSAVELKVAEQGNKLDNLESVMGALATSSHDIAKGVESLRIEMAADRGLTERTWNSVDRLQNYFIEDAFAKRSGR